MAFGNKLGVTVDTDVTTDTLFAPGFGNIVAEVPAGKTAEVYEALHNAGLSANVKRAGAVNEEAAFICGDMKLAIDEALNAWTGTLEKVFPTRATEDKEEVKTDLYHADSVYVCKHKVARPTVFIPVFPSTTVQKRLSAQVRIRS